MSTYFRRAIQSLAAACACAVVLGAQETAREPPREWIDPDAGHRVIRLSVFRSNMFGPTHVLAVEVNTRRDRQPA